MTSRGSRVRARIGRASAVAALTAGLAVTVGGGTAEATPPGLDCFTEKHNNDPSTGFAFCVNRGTAPQTFWVHLVCGLAFDQDGEHVTVAPGQSGQSTAHCGGTGIGEMTVQP
ncbi:hypothetical protein [Streptomyces sp. NPDC003077]|uniref:hypothetical protein n=1 Tax=Streptomyces sp. NPDC003077 TaxID=3154443 RepID=UPI0033B366BA